MKKTSHQSSSHYDQSDLLKHFATASAERFSFLRSQFSCDFVQGYSTFDERSKPSTLRARGVEPIPNIFWFISRFSDRKAIIEIGYGDRELIISAQIFYPDHCHRFGMWELLLSVGAGDLPDASGSAWVTSRPFMDEVLSRIASALETYWEILRNPTPALVHRTLESRSARTKSEHLVMRAKERDRAFVLASQAFHLGDYPKTWSLLEPFAEDVDLPRSAKMLYVLSKRGG